MDPFDALARSYFAKLIDHGVIIPREQRSAMLEALAIDCRAASFAALNITALSPLNPSEADIAMRHSLSVVDEIAAERIRQQKTEGYVADHDDRHNSGGELVLAAISYCLADCFAVGSPPRKGYLLGESASATIWPWAEHYRKPKDKRLNLIRAAALLVAEIERLDRYDHRENERMDAGIDALIDRIETRAKEDGFNPAGSGPEPITERRDAPEATMLRQMGDDEPQTPAELHAGQAAQALEDR